MNAFTRQLKAFSESTSPLIAAMDETNAATPMSGAASASDNIRASSLSTIIENADRVVDSPKFEVDQDPFSNIENAQLFVAKWVSDQSAKVSMIPDRDLRDMHLAEIRGQAEQADLFIQAKKDEYAYEEGVKLDPDSRNTMMFLMSQGITGRDAVRGAQDHHLVSELVSNMRISGDEGSSMVSRMMSEGDKAGIISIDPNTGVYSVNNRTAFETIARRFVGETDAAEKAKQNITQSVVEGAGMGRTKGRTGMNMSYGADRDSSDSSLMSVDKTAKTIASIKEQMASEEVSPIMQKKMQDEIDEVLVNTESPRLEQIVYENSKILEPLQTKYAKQLNEGTPEALMEIPDGERAQLAGALFSGLQAADRANRGVAAMERGVVLESFKQAVSGKISEKGTDIGLDEVEELIAQNKLAEGIDVVLLTGSPDERVKKRFEYFEQFSKNGSNGFLDTIFIDVAGKNKVIGIESGANIASNIMVSTGGSGEALGYKGTGKSSGARFGGFLANSLISAADIASGRGKSQQQIVMEKLAPTASSVYYDIAKPITDSLRPSAEAAGKAIGGFLRDTGAAASKKMADRFSSEEDILKRK